MKLKHKELIEQARMMGIPAHEFAASFITRDLVAHCLDVLRKADKPFKNLTEQQQGKVIDDLTVTTKDLVEAAVAVIAAKGTSAIGLALKSVLFSGKTLRVVGDVDANDPQRHALTDTVNQRALLVLVEDEYYDALDSNKPERDQQDLPLPESDASAVDSAPAEPALSPYDLAYGFVLNGGEISPKAIGAAAGVKRKEVAELILQLAENGVISGPDEDGHRTLLLAPQTDAAPAAEASPAKTPDTKSAAPTLDDDQYADAVLLVQREQKVSISFLKSELAIDEDTAEAFIARMEVDGVVSEENDMGGRSVFN
ncbi:Ftsk gamma domain protein [compost metagenome]